VNVYEELARRAAKGETLALATVIGTEGSSPAQAAMKMLVSERGRVAGTVGGGRVEATIERAAQATIGTGRASTISFTLDDDLADEGGLLCGGTVRILVERVEPPATWAAEAAEARRRGRRAALLAKLGDTVERTLVVDEVADAWLHDELPRLEGETFVEPLFRPRCILLGAGHVGRSVARVAAEAGFAVAIVEDREEQAARAEADEVVRAELTEGLAGLDPGPWDFIVVMTRSHGLDFRCVRAALLSPARYVGMLASRRKTEALAKKLEDEGVDATRLEAPVGLDLGAKNAGEIAVSVVAQMVRLRRTGRAGR